MLYGLNGRGGWLIWSGSAIGGTNFDKEFGMSRIVRMSDFEWACAARYIEYISVTLQLNDIDMERVLGFRLRNTATRECTIASLRQLARQKERFLEVVTTNSEKLTNWVRERQHEGYVFEQEELAVLRSLYKQYTAVIELLDDHVDRANSLLEFHLNAASVLDVGQEGDQNEPPF